MLMIRLSGASELPFPVSKVKTLSQADVFEIPREFLDVDAQ
jgi:hypothetical protein